MASRNTRANILLEVNAATKTTTDLNKQKLYQGDVSVYIKNVDFIFLRHQYKYMKHKGKTIKTDANFCWMRSSSLASVEVIEFRTTEAYSNLDLTKVKYSTCKHSGRKICMLWSE
jgi:cellobiose-specific phosphotransferase system component IIB